MTTRSDKFFTKHGLPGNADAEAASLRYQITLPSELSSMLNVYRQCKATAYITDLPEHKKKMAEALQRFVEKVKPEFRLPHFTREMVDKSFKSEEIVDMKSVVSAFEILENYALRLIWYPWQKQFWKIKVYAAFLKLYVDPHLKGTKEFFRQLGYESNKQTNEIVIKQLPNNDVLFQLALDCCIAQKEMEIYITIYDNVKHEGFTERDVMTCRMQLDGTHKEAVLWIHDHCEPTRPKTIITNAVVKIPKTPSSLDSNTKSKPKTASNGKKIKSLEIDKERLKRLETYEEEAKKAPALPKRTTSAISQSFIKDIKPEVFGKSTFASQRHDDIPFIDSGAYDEGTLEDHVTESMRLIDRSAGAGKAESAYRLPIGTSGAEWQEVYQAKETFGKSYNDPGGRGDILQGDEMVPLDDDEDNEEYPAPPPPINNQVPPRHHEFYRQHIDNSHQRLSNIQSPYAAARYASHPITSATPSGYDPNTYEKRFHSSPLDSSTDLYSSSKTSGYRSITDRESRDRTFIPKVNVMKNTDPYGTTSAGVKSITSPTLRTTPNQPMHVADNFRSLQLDTDYSDGYGNQNIRAAENESKHIVGLLPHQQQRDTKYTRDFSTFRGDDDQTRSLQKLNVNSHSTMDEPDYVQLKQISPRGGGKPNFETNMQATAQRLYQSPISNTVLSRQSSVDRQGQNRTQQPATRSREVTSPQTHNVTITATNNNISKEWQCKDCSFINIAGGRICGMCHTAATGDRRALASRIEVQCPQCTFVNTERTAKCTMCGSLLKESPTLV